MVLTKALGITVLVLGLSAGVMGYLLKKSYEENGSLEHSVKQLTQDVRDWEKSFDDMEGLYLEANRSLEERDAAGEKDRKLVAVWKDRYEQEKLINEDLRKWAASRVPTVWWDGVREFVRDLNHERSSQAGTSE